MCVDESSTRIYCSMAVHMRTFNPERCQMTLQPEASVELLLLACHRLLYNAECVEVMYT